MYWGTKEKGTEEQSSWGTEAWDIWYEVTSG